MAATQQHAYSTASHLPREWRFDGDSCAFVSDGARIRVLSLRAGEAALVDGAKEQVEDLYRDLFELAGHPLSRAKNAVARAFFEPTDPTEAARLARTVLACYDAKPDEPSARVAGYTRVVHDGERVIVSSIAVTFELSEDAQQQVLRATVIASEELAVAMAKEAMEENPGQPVMIWRGQLGASDYAKSLFEREGYSTQLTDRLEMTAWLKELRSADDEIDDGAVAVDGVEIRALHLTGDDVKGVFDVVKHAYGPSPPSFEAWKRHYAQQPRFAADLSFVAWKGETPIAGSFVELIVEGEGGGDEEVARVFNTDGVLLEDAKTASLSEPLKFADDYEERKHKIRATATTGYVCGIATLPAYRGKRLAQTLLRHNFRAAARAGLESVFLGTDRQNPAAVRAYTRAGMVETKATNNGFVTAKIVFASP